MEFASRTAGEYRPAVRHGIITASSSPAVTLLSTCRLHLVLIATAIAFTRASGVSRMPQASLQQCCTDQRMTEACSRELCGFQSVADPPSVSLSCYFDIDKVFRCLSGRRNARSCCESQLVPARCSQLCSGSDSRPMMIDDLRCLQHLPAAARCFHHVYVRDRVPGPPADLSLISVSSSRVVLSWSPSSFNADSVQSYVVQYTSRHTNSTRLTPQKVATVDERLAISDLTPSTQYEVSVLAVGKTGTSWPSSPLTFITYPISNSEGHSQFAPTANSSQQQHQELLSEPRELVVTNRSQYSLSLSWKRPAFIVQPVAGYRIHYRQADAVPAADDETWNIIKMSSSQTEVILQNLYADSDYSVIVTAVSSSSSTGRPSPAVTVRTLPEGTVRKVEVMKDLTGCCREHNVSSSCMPVCAGSGVINTRTCAEEFIKIIACAADGKDHTECCYRRSVPSPCHAYCTGHALDSNLQAFLCFAYTEEIFSCFREGTGRLPMSPERFELVDMGLTSATFSWLSDPHTDAQQAYRLHYKSLSTDDDYGAIENVRSPYTLQGLVASTTYSVYVVAVNQFGVSEPSSIVSFHLLPPDTGSVRIVQSPAGFASLGARLLLSCSYTAADTAWPVKVSWLRGRRTVMQGNWLLIERVTRDDEGRYTCVVDRHGQLMSADTVVRVQFAPTATPLKRHVQADIGHTAHLVCRFTGHPDSISWYHGRTGAPVVGSRYSVTRYINEDIGAVDSRLSIDMVTRRDYGSYRCKAINVYSATDALVSLTGSDWVPTVATAVSHATSQPTTSNCCVEAGVVERCRRACADDDSLSAVDDLDSECAADLPKILHCASGGLNHSGCCASVSVPGDCLSLCSGRVVHSSLHAACLPHVHSIVSCLRQALANAPSQPENVRLSMTSSGHVLVAWDAPTVNKHLVDFYLVQYSADSAAGQITTNSSLVAHERFVILTEVEAFTTYDVIVAAGNRDVISLPSVPAHITTLDNVAPVTPPSGEFHHKVALAVCLVLFCVATIVFVVIARRYCCFRLASKQKRRRDGLDDPVIFDNLDYSRLSDAPDAAAAVRWGAESTSDVRRSLSASSTVANYHTHHDQRAPADNARHQLHYSCT